jgi:site-specific DNA recombinase
MIINHISIWFPMKKLFTLSLLSYKEVPMSSYSLHNSNFPDGEYGMYLRKSRADLEAEAHGEGETLLRHEHTLQKLAKTLNIRISKKYIYREVVSGETIAARPEVQQMLSDVETGALAGVFVMEIERLARGDTSDQGMVAKAFKQYNTLIITPTKTYNPANDADEEYFEFGLFMSRREFKTINRRIQSGRIAAASEGRYIASTAPYGYERIKIKNDKGYTLRIIPKQAEVIRSIYEWYVTGALLEDRSHIKLGATRIADRLNEMGVKPVRNNQWTRSSIIDILRNPVYAGKIRWGYKKEKKYTQDNKLHKRRNRSATYSLVNGLHEAIINEDLFNAAQSPMSTRTHAPIPGNDTLKNPFTGILYCGKCGRMMTRLAKTTKTPYDVVKCPNTKCDNISSPLYLVEEVVLQSLQIWLSEFKAKWNTESITNPYSGSIIMAQSAIDQLQSEINKLSVQRNRLHDLLEREVYSPDIFIQRNKKLTADIEALQNSMTKNKNELENLQLQSSCNDIYIPNAEYVLSEYCNMNNASIKNDALKEIVERITYIKNVPNKKGYRDNKNFEIVIDPKVVKF